MNKTIRFVSGLALAALVTFSSPTRAVEDRPRERAISGFSFALGPAAFGGMETSGVGYSFSIAKIWDVQTALVRLKADWSGMGFSSAYALDFGLGGTFFVFPGLIGPDHAPFLGAELGYGVASQGTTNLNGFWLTAATGAVLFRNMSVELELSLRWSVLLQSSAKGTPNYMALRVGLLF